MYEEIVGKEFERALSILLTSIEIGGQEVSLFRADMLSAGVKASIGRCLLAFYLDAGRIDNCTKAVVVHGAGNTVKAVKAAVDELALNIKVVAVVYAETSGSTIENLREMGIEVIAETPRREGRVGRLTAAEGLCQRETGYVFLEQHEQPLIIDIQRRTFGRAIVERLQNSPTYFVGGVGTGGTVFGIGSALRNVNPDIRIIAVEGVGSTLTLWHAYSQAKGKGYRTERAAVQRALFQYAKAGMAVSLKSHPRRKNPEEWFEIDIDFPPTWAGVVGIEGLGVGDPTNLILEHLLEVSEVRIVTDMQAAQGVKLLESHGIYAVESAGANFFVVMTLARDLQRRGRKGHILTIVTATRGSFV